MNPQSNDLQVSGQFSFKRKYEQVDKLEGNGSNTSLDSDDGHSQDNNVTSSPDSVIDPTKKPSPTNQKLMSDLKTVKIDRSEYRHYGHQSLMTSQSLEQIISEGKRKEEEEIRARKLLEQQEAKSVEVKEEKPQDSERENESEKEKEVIPEVKKDEEWSKKVEPISTYTSNTPATASTVASAAASSNSSGVQLLVADLLNINSTQPLPYSIDTIHEIIRLKTEEEITKQVQIKHELAQTTLELLKYAQTLNISPELIPMLFVGNNAVNEVKANLQRLRVDPQSILKQIEDQARISTTVASSTSTKKQKRHDKTPSLPSISDIGKQNMSKQALPGGSAEAPSSTHSGLVSPLRSPNRLPDFTHKKNKSDASDITSPYMSNTKPVLLPLPGTNHQKVQHYSQHPLHPQHQMQPHPHLLPVQYPLFYNSPPGQGEDRKYLGSPYSQKHSQGTSSKLQQNLPPLRNLYPLLKQPPQQHQHQQQHQQQQQQQQYYYATKQAPQYQYYVATTPPHGPQYVMQQVPMAVPYPPAMGGQAVPPMVGPSGSNSASGSVNSAAASAPSNSGSSAAQNTETERSKVPGGGSILRFDKTEPEDQPVTKKPKLMPKSSGINFMISTPENPPAKKYNNSRS